MSMVRSSGYNQITSKLQTSNLSKMCLAVETFFCVWNDGWHPLEQKVVILGEILGVYVRHAYPILQLKSMFQLNYFLKQNWNFILYLILKVSLLTNHSKRFVCSRNQSRNKNFLPHKWNKLQGKQAALPKHAIFLL